MLADQLCPECHGQPTLEYVSEAKPSESPQTEPLGEVCGIAGYLRKRCTECGHRWLEVRPPDPLPREDLPMLQVPIAEARRMRRVVTS